MVTVRLLSSFFLAALALAVNAQKLTLAECRDSALLCNASVRQEGNSRVQAELQRKEVFTKFFPQISGGAVYLRNNKPIVDYSVDVPFELPASMEVMGMTVPLPNMEIPPVEIALRNDMYIVSLSFLQPVYMGGKIVNGYRLTKVAREVGELRERQTREDVIAKVDQTYYQLTALKAKRETLRAALLNVEQIHRNVVSALQAGIVTNNDLLEVQLKQGELRSDSIDLENGIELCGLLLAQQIGSARVSVDIAESDFSALPEIPQGLAREPSEAVGESAAYQMLDRKVRAAELQRKTAVGEQLPNVVVGGSLSINNLLADGTKSAMIMAGVQVPLSGWWGGSHAIKGRKLDEASARTERDDKARLLQINVRHSWDELNAAQRKAAIAQEAIAQSEENLRLYTAFYKAGTATITDLLDAQTKHRQAADRYTEACANFQVKLTEYRIATNQL